MNTRALILLLAAAACRGTEPGEVRLASVVWMEWPAEVVANQPYQVRVVIPPLCSNGQLVFRQFPSDSTLLFDAQWVNVRPLEWGCEPAGPIYEVSTRDGAPIAGAPRTLEIRGSRFDGSHQRFGTLTTVTGGAEASILAAGYVRLSQQSTGACPRIAIGAWEPNSSVYQIEGLPAGGEIGNHAWVEGYIAYGRTVCSRQAGDTIVFHLTSTLPN